MKLILQLEWEFVQDVENRWINGTLVLRMDDVLERISFCIKKWVKKLPFQKKSWKTAFYREGKYLTVRLITWSMLINRFLGLKLWMNTRKWLICSFSCVRPNCQKILSRP